MGSDNGLSPDRRQAIIWTNAGLLLIGTLGTNLSEILIEILTFSFKKMRLKVSAKRRPFCLGLSVLNLLVTSGAVVVIYMVVECGLHMCERQWQSGISAILVVGILLIDAMKPCSVEHGCV